MRFNDIIRLAMQDTTQSQLGERLGIRQNSVSNTINRPNITLAKFITVMDVLGYDIIIKSRDTDHTEVVTND